MRPAARHHRRAVLGRLPTGPAHLADCGYEGAGQGIHTPVKQPTDGNRLAIDNRTYNRLPRSLRGLGERGFALLTGRWYALGRTTASPRSVGDIVRAALVLTQFEYRYLLHSR
ncbi:transposase family protein [Micromonospora sp. NPDC005206]|uniref:transposase family protein n=1 Tax=Micromonospora sp. NPDC005206 TaxID=3157022 RepID=UPI0033A99D1A